jgi:hypothetical protein
VAELTVPEPPAPPIWLQVKALQPHSFPFDVLNRNWALAEQEPAGSLVTKITLGGVDGWAARMPAANKKARSFIN